MKLEPESSARFRTWLSEGHARPQPACAAPFVTLSFQGSGLVYSCARKPAAVVGDVRRQSLREIWHGARVAALRRLLEAERFEDDCLVCGWFAARGNFEAADIARYRHFPVAERDPRYPRRLEFNLGNACNLECVHCTGELSSRIRARREHLPPLPRVYGPRFFAELEEFLPHLEDACFLGGEPFLLPECFAIWNRLIERELPVRCLITTNGTCFSEEVARVLSALPVQLSVSLDGATAATVESIRIGVRFDALLDNLRRFRRLVCKPGDRLILTYALMLPNWSDFGDFIALAESLEADVTLNVLTDPPEMSLFRLPRAELRVIVDAMTAEFARRCQSVPRNVTAWKAILELLRQHAESSAEAGMPFEQALVESRSRREGGGGPR